MRPHLAYLSYVLRHKWYVFLACLPLHVPIWRAVFHDWTKFLPCEWFPYAEYFYGKKQSREWFDNGGIEGEATLPYGAYVKERFEYAWNHHQKQNRHHWQYWIRLNDDGDVLTLPMPDTYRREMLADWRGAGRALGKPDTAAWYEANKDKMKLHPDTRAWIEEQLALQKQLDRLDESSSGGNSDDRK